jgi:MFS transporter, ACS family, tartrate transporter
MALYFVPFLDRVNISFAALTMNRDLGIGPTLFGLAAGIFFFGYFLFELPSNLALLRVGAGRWIMLLMLAWGSVSVATAFVRGPVAYITLRFLLVSAEAGFYPGAIPYLTFWLPADVRSRVMAAFVTAIPLSTLVGSMISAQILLIHHAFGLKGWQWLFILRRLARPPARPAHLVRPAQQPRRRFLAHHLRKAHPRRRPGGGRASAPATEASLS